MLPLDVFPADHLYQPETEGASFQLTLCATANCSALYQQGTYSAVSFLTSRDSFSTYDEDFTTSSMAPSSSCLCFEPLQSSSHIFLGACFPVMRMILLLPEWKNCLWRIRPLGNLRGLTVEMTKLTPDEA